jgi:hypothetical protein
MGDGYFSLWPWSKPQGDIQLPNEPDRGLGVKKDPRLPDKPAQPTVGAAFGQAAAGADYLRKSGIFGNDTSQAAPKTPASPKSLSSGGRR